MLWGTDDGDQADDLKVESCGNRPKKLCEVCIKSWEIWKKVFADSGDFGESGESGKVAGFRTQRMTWTEHKNAIQRIKGQVRKWVSG